MKHYICTLALAAALFTGSAYAQFGLKISVAIPSGNYYPYLLKPGIGGEFDFKLGDIDDRFKIGIILGYYKFKATQDTFRTYAIGGNPVQLYPGYEVIHSYSILQVGPSCDFKVLPDSKFSPVIGLDFFINVIGISEDNYAENLVNSHSTGDIYYNYAIQPRLGMQYQYNSKWLFTAGIERSMGFGGEIGQQAFWKPYLGAMIYLKD